MRPVDIEDEDYSPSDLVPTKAGATQNLVLKVPLSLAGMRFDQALAEMLPDYSRSRLTAMVKEGAILLNGVAAAPKAKLTGGETIAASLHARPEESAFLPEDLPINVIHEDDAVIVIDKPAGLVVHPAAGNWSGTLLNGLLFRNPEVSNLPRAGIVHRLDKDTTGVMVVAKTEAAQLALVRQLQARSVKRIYLALVRGKLRKDGTVDAPIGRHSHQRTRMAVMKDAHAGKPAVTHYRVLEKFQFHTMVECRLETGRTHQIRVHMQSIGFPLEGDLVYGATLSGIDDDVRTAIRAFGRQALHARKLSFIHPVTSIESTFEAPVPDDMSGFVTYVAGLG